MAEPGGGRRSWWRRGRAGGPPELPGTEAPQQQEDPGDRPEALIGLLDVTDRFVNSSAGRLPIPVVVDVRALTDTVREIVDTTAQRPLDVHALISVRAILEDYLPTTLRSFLAVDEELRDVPRRGGPPPVQALAEQVDVLNSSAEATLRGVREQDVDALTTQGRFLRTKFTRSDLEL